MVAGAPLTNDIGKCQLKPINFAEYKQTVRRSWDSTGSAVGVI